MKFVKLLVLSGLLLCSYVLNADEFETGTVVESNQCRKIMCISGWPNKTTGWQTTPFPVSEGGPG